MTGRWRVLWGMAGLLLSLQAMAEVYKYIDRDGNLVLTDKKVPGAVPVVVPPTMTMPFPKGASGGAPAPAAASQADTGAYTITITSPAAGATYRRNQDAGIPVAASVSPSLKEGLSLQLLLDGAPIAGGEVALEGINRGSHTISARIVDAQGKDVEDGPSNTFFVQQASELLGPHAKDKSAPNSGQGQ